MLLVRYMVHATCYVWCISQVRYDATTDLKSQFMLRS